MVENRPGIQIVCIGTASLTVKRWICFYLLGKQPFPFILLVLPSLPGTPASQWLVLAAPVLARSANLHLSMPPYCSGATQRSSSATVTPGEQQCGGVEQVRHKSSGPASAMNSPCAIKPLLFSQLRFLQGAHLTTLY